MIYTADVVLVNLLKSCIYIPLILYGIYCAYICMYE